MKRLRKASNSRSSKRCDLAHVTDAKFASLYEKGDDDVAEEPEVERGDEAGYGQSRQPRQTWRMSSNKLSVNQQQQKMFICSKCGKAFQSSKALCGHMACHSQKYKASTLSNQKQLVIMDSQSDTESGAKNLRRSLKRAEFKKVDPVADSRSKLNSYNNCSSGASGVKFEQEEVAICLMMLSRDLANWGGLNSVGVSSDSNSVVLEARSVGTNIAKKDCLRRSKYDVDESVRKFGGKKITSLGDSESGGYVRIGVKNVGSDVKCENSWTNKQDKGSRTEQNSSLNKYRRAVDGNLEYGLRRDGERCSLTERAKVELYSRMCEGNGSYNAANHYSNAEMYRRFKHKAFKANVAGNTKSFVPAASTHERGGNSFETDGSHDVTKGKGIVEHHSSNVGDNRKKRKHKCPVCFNVFRSVQALGSHRRVHLAQGSADINKSDEVAAISKWNGTHKQDFIDLNLPAPMEDAEAIWSNPSTSSAMKYLSPNQFLCLSSSSYD